MFLQILLLVIGVAMIALGTTIIVRAKKVIQAIQKQKFHVTAEPRKSEILMARILGGLVTAIGIYYSAAAIVSIAATAA